MHVPDGSTAYQLSPSCAADIDVLGIVTPRPAKCATVASVLEIGKVADVLPAGIVTLKGTVTQAKPSAIVVIVPPDGAVWKLVTVPVALAAPMTTEGISLIGYGVPAPHRSPNEKVPPEDCGSQPEARHSSLNVQCPTVPGVGPAKQV